MKFREIATPHAPKAIGPYAQAVQCPAGEFFFLSGQTPLDPQTGKLVEGTIERETEQVFLNLAAVLKAAGLSFDFVARCSVFLTDLGDFEAMNAVYDRHFQNHKPARTTVQVSALPRGARVEIDAIAVREVR